MTTDPNTKILSDLSTVSEKIALCQSMLIPLSSVDEIYNNESLLSIIGFLEACVPRVRELINIGIMSGGNNNSSSSNDDDDNNEVILKEETMTVCLNVNDDLCKILDDVEHPERITTETVNTKTTNTDTATSVAASASATSEVDDILNDIFDEECGLNEVTNENDTNNDNPDLHVKPAAPKSTVLEDLLTPPSSTTTMNTTTNTNIATVSDANTTDTTSSKNTDDNDEFDTFFENRIDKNSFSIDD